MPNTQKTDIPESVKNVLPKHAQEIYKAALNHALEEYNKPSKRRTKETKEEVAHKVAWSAVKKKYHKEGENWKEN